MDDLQTYLDKVLPKIKLSNKISEDAIDNYDIYHEIALLFVSIRTDLGLTQGQLAEITGVSQANISKFENENSKPTINTLDKIAKGLNKRLTIRFEEREHDE